MYNSGIVKAMFCVRFTYVIELFWIKISVNFVERERERIARNMLSAKYVEFDNYGYNINF